MGLFEPEFKKVEAKDEPGYQKLRSDIWKRVARGENVPAAEVETKLTTVGQTKQRLAADFRGVVGREWGDTVRALNWADDKVRLEADPYDAHSAEDERLYAIFAEVKDHHFAYYNMPWGDKSPKEWIEARRASPFHGFMAEDRANAAKLRAKFEVLQRISAWCEEPLTPEDELEVITRQDVT